MNISLPRAPFLRAGWGALLVLVSACFTLASARERLDGGEWSWEQLLQLARHGNLELQSSKLAVEGLRWDRLAAWGNLMPSLQLNSSYAQSRSRIFNYEFPDGSIQNAQLESKSTNSATSISLRQPIFEGFSRIAALRMAQLEEQNVLSADQRQEQLLEHSLRKAGHAVMAATDRLELEQELLEQKLRQQDLAALRLRLGKGTELDRLQSELEVGRQRVQIEAAAADLQSAWDQLALLLGVESGEPGKLDLPFTVFEPDWEEAELVEQALRQRPDLQDVERRRNQARYDVIQKRSVFLPVLSLDLQHYRDLREDGLRAWSADQENYTNSARLSLSLPLFQGFSNLNAYQRSKAQLRQRELEEEQQKLQVQADIREALQRLESAWKQSLLTHDNLELARQSLRLERERFKQGLASLLHLKDAEAVWRQAMNEDLQQRLAFRDRLAELELALGAPLQR